jgi:hypothetical protein
MYLTKKKKKKNPYNFFFFLFFYLIIFFFPWIGAWPTSATPVPSLILSVAALHFQVSRFDCVEVVGDIGVCL